MDTNRSPDKLPPVTDLFLKQVVDLTDLGEVENHSNKDGTILSAQTVFSPEPNQLDDILSEVNNEEVEDPSGVLSQGQDTSLSSLSDLPVSVVPWTGSPLHCAGDTSGKTSGNPKTPARK